MNNFRKLLEGLPKTLSRDIPPQTKDGSKRKRRGTVNFPVPPQTKDGSKRKRRGTLNQGDVGRGQSMRF